jgi:hypothetical protein
LPSRVPDSSATVYKSSDLVLSYPPYHDIIPYSGLEWGRGGGPGRHRREIPTMTAWQPSVCAKTARTSASVKTTDNPRGGAAPHSFPFCAPMTDSPHAVRAFL